ncbi:hypothetical protein FA743_19385 [Paracoccus gahaiensis]|uniref:Transposase n=1 Tax=Paracoccus gahaiensis TaxID=1706839 RepID=A0A4U0R2P2_9RHOB|nr:hypothetical protein FA743_19385 [Paracoccus gahaiensis]
MVGLAAEGFDPQMIMIDATYLKAHRTAYSLHAKMFVPPRLQASIFDEMISLRMLRRDPDLHHPRSTSFQYAARPAWGISRSARIT